MPECSKKKYVLVINDWPVEGCRRIQSFETFEEANDAANAFLAVHAGKEDKIMLIRGEILSIGAQ